MSESAFVTVIGAAAGTLTTVAYIPQVIKTLRSGTSADLSLTMWLTMTTGAALWLTYGLLLANGPLIAANLVSLVLIGSVTANKLLHMRAERRRKERGGRATKTP